MQQDTPDNTPPFQRKLDRRRKWMIIKIVFFAAMGGMLYGYDVGILTGAMLFIRQDIPMNVFQESLLGAAVLGGGAFAILLGGYLADKFGRRKMIRISGVIFLFSVLMIFVAQSFWLLFIGRIIQGISVGFVSITIPLYLTETAPARIRGLAVTSFQLMLTAGILLANLVSLLLSEAGAWREMFLTAGIPAVIMLAGSFFIARSPRWLIIQGNTQHAYQELEKVYPEDQAKQEFAMMKNVAANISASTENFLQLMCQKKYLKPLFCVFSIAILTQLLGINSFIQFAALLLRETGMESNWVSIAGASVVSSINLVVTIIVMMMADRFERKHLVSIGAIGIALTLFIGGGILLSLESTPFKGWVLLLSLMLFIVFYGGGPGAFVWVLLSETLPTAIRSKGLSIGLFLNSLASSALASVFLPLEHTIDIGGVFLFCGSCAVLYVIIAIFFLPQTKNRTLEEIEQQYE